MKYLTLFIISFLFLACSTSLVHQKGSRTLEDYIKKGLPIFYDGKQFDQPLDLTKMIESFQVSSIKNQGIIKSPMYFKNCTFKGPVLGYMREELTSTQIIFENAIVFENCFFEEEINFKSAIFKGGLDFTGSTFMKKVNFEEVRCYQNAVFSKVIFESEVRMQNIYCYEQFIMKDGQSKDIFSMQGSVIHSNVNLGITKFFGYTDFSRCRVEGSFLANYSEFHDRLLLSNSSLKDRVDFIGTFMNDGLLKGNVFTGKTRFVKIKGSFKMKDNIFVIDPESDKSIVFE